MRSFSIIIILALFCTACQKKDSTVPDANKVTINVASPLPSQSYHSNDTVYINADVSYVSELHGYEVIVEDTATGFTVYDEVQHVHADHFVINDKWVNAVLSPTTYRLSVSATIDHSGTIATKEVFFTIIP